MRPLTSIGFRAMMDHDTEYMWGVFVRISHTSWADDILVVDNNEDTMLAGTLYTAFPFEIQLEDSDVGKEQKITLSIDNVDSSIIEQFRMLSDSPYVQIAIGVIEKGTPPFCSTPEISLDRAEFTNLTYNNLSITGDLQYSNVFMRAYPNVHYNYTPAIFPSLFQPAGEVNAAPAEIMELQTESSPPAPVEDCFDINNIYCQGIFDFLDSTVISGTLLDATHIHVHRFTYSGVPGFFLADIDMADLVAVISLYPNEVMDSFHPLGIFAPLNKSNQFKFNEELAAAIDQLPLKNGQDYYLKISTVDGVIGANIDYQLSLVL